MRGQVETPDSPLRRGWCLRCKDRIYLLGGSASVHVNTVMDFQAPQSSDVCSCGCGSSSPGKEVSSPVDVETWYFGGQA